MATLEDVLAEVKKNSRGCPQPQRWKQLYDMLPNKQRKGIGWEPSLPLILAAWWDTPALPKMLRLREHIEWAALHGCFAAVHSFLLKRTGQSFALLGRLAPTLSGRSRVLSSHSRELT